MKLPIIERPLHERLVQFAKKLQMQFGYKPELAYMVAYNWARSHWAIVVVDGVAREIRPTTADGRVA